MVCTLATVEKQEQKLVSMKNKGKLKAMPEKIYIDDDLSPRERNTVQRKIREREENKKTE